MSELSKCLGWTGRRVWLGMSAGASGRVNGVIVHAFPTPFDRTLIDLAVRLDRGTFTVVAASERGVKWDFETTSVPKSVGEGGVCLEPKFA